MSLQAFARLHPNYGTDLVPGVDVSGHNTPDRLAAALGWGRFAWIKATQGVHFYEPDVTAAHVAVCRQRGVPYGFYHFANQRDGVFANNDPKAEAAWFSAAIASQGGPGQLPPALDYEAPDAPGDQSAWTLTFLAELERLTGRLPAFYSYAGWISSHLSAPELARFPLWLAHYASPGADAWCPVGPWRDWVAWQYQSVTPEHGSLDVNVARPAWFADLDSLGAASVDDGFTEADRSLLALLHRAFR